MRIISSKKDYYDGVAAHGMDRDIVYVREPKDSVFTQGWCFPIIPHVPIGYGAECHVIGFCGKIYPAIELRAPVSPTAYVDPTVKPDPSEYMFYDFEHVDAMMVKHLSKNNLEVYESGKHRVRNYYYGRNNTRAYWKNFFERFADFTDKFEKVFQDFNVPVFVISYKNQKTTTSYPYRSEQGIILNAILKNYAFAKIKDPYTAFQELRMFFSNMAQPDRPMLTMTDEQNAERLGHGGKYSFKKAPTKKVLNGKA